MKKSIAQERVDDFRYLEKMYSFTGDYEGFIDASRQWADEVLPYRWEQFNQYGLVVNHSFDDGSAIRIEFDPDDVRPDAVAVAR